MSVTAIRAAFEKRLNQMAPSLATAYENAGFVPPPLTTPYQQCHLLLATPDNPESGSGYRELGIFQVTLLYPLQEGSGAAATRAKAVREWFPKNYTMTQSGVVVVVNRTPAIGNGVPDGERWRLPVKIPFFANIFS